MQPASSPPTVTRTQQTQRRSPGCWGGPGEFRLPRADRRTSSTIRGHPVRGRRGPLFSLVLLCRGRRFALALRSTRTGACYAARVALAVHAYGCRHRGALSPLLLLGVAACLALPGPAHRIAGACFGCCCARKALPLAARDLVLVHGPDGKQRSTRRSSGQCSLCSGGRGSASTDLSPTLSSSGKLGRSQLRMATHQPGSFGGQGWDRDRPHCWASQRSSSPRGDAVTPSPSGWPR